MNPPRMNPTTARRMDRKNPVEEPEIEANERKIMTNPRRNSTNGGA